LHRHPCPHHSRRTVFSRSFGAPSPNRRAAEVSVRGLGDRMLDFIEGGPKLRKWYGQGERPTDGGGVPGQGSQPEPVPEPSDVPRDSVLVTDAESPTGQAIVLQLILGRQKVRVLVKNTQAAAKEYGPYVTPVSGDVSSIPDVKRALEGARVVVVAGKVGPHLLATAKAVGVEHVLLPSLAGGQGGGFGFFGSDSALRDASREAAAAAAGIPHTIVRAAAVVDRPGGDCQLSFSAGSPAGKSGGGGKSGEISREDLARVVVGALECPPADGLTFTVTAAGPGGPPEDWEEALRPLLSAS